MKHETNSNNKTTRK